jgi:hypothetical protein
MILPGLKLVVLLLCGQGAKLSTEGINITMQPLLNTIKPSHDGLKHSSV